MDNGNGVGVEVTRSLMQKDGELHSTPAASLLTCFNFKIEKV